ncbi:MAG: hypothetical protein SVY53_03345, partial [Chloroflexota bacterium]|nr:hypothetical protein [Chloroflexota bacterium]
IYYDLRLRKEEFNIAIMASELGYGPVGGSPGQDVSSPWPHQSSEEHGYSSYDSDYSSQQDGIDHDSE